MNLSGDTLSHLYVFAFVFFVTLSIVKLIPGLYSSYKDSYSTRSNETARELNKFFINIKPTQIIAAAGVLGVVLGILTQSWVVALAILGAGAAAPKMVLSIWREARSAKVEAQLMDALLLISNSLRSGLDIVAGMERVVTNMPAPISEEFGLVMNAYRLGSPLERSLLEMLERINSRTLETVVYAINIQRETGGNIIKIFDQLVTTIREENKLQKKARAITAQARSQIYFLAGFPWFLAVLFVIMSPDMMKPAVESTWGQIVIVFLLVWEVIGIVVTKKIVAIEV